MGSVLKELNKWQSFLWEDIFFRVDKEGALWVEAGYWDDRQIIQLPELIESNSAWCSLSDAYLVEARRYLDSCRIAAQCVHVQNAFIGEGGYAWMWKRLVNLADRNNTELNLIITEYARMMLVPKGDLAARFVGQYGVPFQMTLEQFLKAADTEIAFVALKKERDRQFAMRILDQVASTTELENRYGLAVGSVKKACQRGQIPARKLRSGEWLVLHQHAAERWGNKKGTR